MLVFSCLPRSSPGRYPPANEELIAANDDYTAPETALQAQIDRIENDYPDYDENRYDLDPIGHDPHQPASYLTALLQYFKADKVQGEFPYDYYILNVSLTNVTVNTVANSLLTAEQLEMYNIYLQTKGSKPLLFGGGSIDGSPSTDLSGVEFVDGERQGNQNTVDIALSQVGNRPTSDWNGSCILWIKAAVVTFLDIPACSKF